MTVSPAPVSFACFAGLVACSSVSGVAWSCGGPSRFARAAAIRTAAREAGVPLRVAASAGVVVLFVPGWPRPAWLSLVAVPF